VTGINSDLPGQIIATVTENVFDTVTGRHLKREVSATERRSTTTGRREIAVA
jgi:hypothetical protein